MKMYRLLILSDKLQSIVRNFPETKMGAFQTGKVILKNGQEYLAEIEDYKFLFYVEGSEKVPFSVGEIDNIIITHESIDVNLYNSRLLEMDWGGLLALQCDVDVGCSIE